MKHPIFKFDQNNNPLIEGDFEFMVSETIYNNSYLPEKIITFPWDPEMVQNIVAFKDNQYDEMYEAIGEKLKQDFIAFIKRREENKSIWKQYTVLLCNGSTTDFDSVSLSSNLSRTSKNNK